MTETSQCAYRDYSGRKLCIIDTPGLKDTKQLNEKVISELKCAFCLACPGPHAFLIVVSGRCTNEVVEVLELLKKIFGNQIVEYCIFIVTRADDLRENDNGQSSDAELIDQYFKEAPQPLLDFMNAGQKRCVLIANRAPFDKREESVALIINMIKAIEEKNGFYTNDMFAQAEREWQEWENNEIKREEQEREQQRKAYREKVTTVEIRKVI